MSSTGPQVSALAASLILALAVGLTVATVNQVSPAEGRAESLAFDFLVTSFVVALTLAVGKVLRFREVVILLPLLFVLSLGVLIVSDLVL